MDNISHAVADIMLAAISNNVEVIISNNSHVIYHGDNSETPCSGYFSGNDVIGERILAVGTGKSIKEWLPVFLHESSHMDQYLENCKEWRNCKLDDGRDSTDLLFDWIGGVEIDNSLEIAMKSLMVELDCERRTVAKILKYNLEDYIEPLEYMQKANSYVYFYLYVAETRKFYTKGKEPYNNPMIWSVAPPHFLGDYSKIPRPLYDAFKRYI